MIFAPLFGALCCAAESNRVYSVSPTAKLPNAHINVLYTAIPCGLCCQFVSLQKYILIANAFVPFILQVLCIL